MTTRTGLRPRRSIANLNGPAAHQTPAPSTRKPRNPPHPQPSTTKISPGEIISHVSSFRISSETLSSPMSALTPMQEIASSTSIKHFPTLLSTPQKSLDQVVMDTPIPPTTIAKPLYPDLSSLTANTELYPPLSMGNPPPARRRLYANTTSTTSSRKPVGGRKSLATTTVLPVTPTKPIDNSTVPKTTTFEFKFSAGLEEAGKKVLDELRVSSVAWKARMGGGTGAGIDGEEAAQAQTTETPAPTRSRRFSAEHRKQFEKMPSIADHYTTRRAKTAAASTTPASKKPDVGLASKSAHPSKTLKRKTVDAEESSKPPPPSTPQSFSTSTTSDTEMTDDSPIARKRAKFATPTTAPRARKAFTTPGPLTATPITKPLQYAGHQHGLTRTTAVKQSAMKQSSLPRVIRKEAFPTTPSKPLAVATPLKKETLLASPSKMRPAGGTCARTPTGEAQPNTPSPVKISIPDTTGQGGPEFGMGMQAPVFDTDKLRKAAGEKPSVRFADAEEEEDEVQESAKGKEKEVVESAAMQMPATARSLFDPRFVLRPSEKRKAGSLDEEDVTEEDEYIEEKVHRSLKTPGNGNKRVRMDIPELNKTFSPVKNTPLNGKGTLPGKPSSSMNSVKRKVTRPVKNQRIFELAMPKRKGVLLSSRTDGGKVVKPRWK